MNNRKNISNSDCKEGLQFLDYLRKSQCTQIGDNNLNAHTYKKSDCKKTLEEMEDIARKCADQTFKQEDNLDRRFGP